MHWLLAGGIIAAFAIAKLGDDEGTAFAYHSIIGLMLVAVVLLRLLSGFFGTRHARFRSLVHSPFAVVQYLKGKSRHAGHNPAEAWAVIAMFALVLLIVASGVLMGMGSETAEDVHEIAVYALLAVAAIHVGGVIAHSLKHRENLAAAMVTGRKIADETQSIRSAAPLAGIGTMVVIGLIGIVLLRGYDSASNTIRLPILGATIQLAENENEGSAGETNDDDDDD